MVGGTPKPFACNKEGCSMTFTTEDHLNVHQKKHEMDLDLSLGNKTNIFVADQTPTPTRFLRNCEEVGLFQDLQNVNPFEETFRRAVESGKIGSLHEPDISVDDTLHTPHVFPLLSEDSIYIAKKCNNNNNNSQPPIITITEHISDENIKDGTNEKDKKSSTSQKEHDYALDVTQDIINNLESTSAKTIKNKAKVRLKQAIKNKKNNLKIVNTNQKPVQQPLDAIFVPQSTMNLATLLLPTSTNLIPLNSLNLVTSNIPEKKKFTEILNEKKKKLRQKSEKTELLERNRAAASRCRKKKKQFIDSLQQDYEKIYAHNNELLEEIAKLKYENAQLKSLLLAHKDCAMDQAKSGIKLGGLIKVNFEVKKSKNRMVLPKTDPLSIPIKVAKLTAAPNQQISADNITILTPISNKKSVIVLPRTPNL